MAALSLIISLTAFAIEMMVLVQHGGGWWLNPHQLFGPVTTIIYALMGALVASRHPLNPIGWIFCTVGVLLALTSLAFAYWVADESGIMSLPGIEFALWLDIWIWIPATMLPLTFLLLLFPDGRLPSPRWRPIAWSAGLGIAAYTLSIALHPEPPIESTPPSNPFGIRGATDILDLLANVALPLLVIGAFGSLAALVVRFRRSRGIEREQLKWLAYASVIAILGLAVSGVLSAIWPDDQWIFELNLIMVNVALALLATASGIAILRYRLYDIDLLINRTVVYGALSAGVVVIYVLLVGSLSILFASSGNFVIALLATGLTALLAQPLLNRLQRGVNRLMYGERDDPYTVLSSLGQQLKTTLAPTAVLPSIAEAVGQALKLPYVALALKQGPGLKIVAAYGMPSGDHLQLPLVYQTETVGQMLVAHRAPGESFTPSERRLLDDIALQAGIAAHAVRLTADLQCAREGLVTAREEERRRLRRDLHDGLGPQLASLTLTVGAARELLRHDPEAADRLLQELARHTQTAITDIRRLVYALRPPALDDLGLVPALREQAAQYSQAGLQVTISAPDQLPPLAAAVEVATYRIVQEALTNVVRHARARTCAVSISLMPGDSLDVQVRDDGVGLPVDGRAGVGLTSMRERAAELGGTFEITSVPGKGTCVRAGLPLHKSNEPDVVPDGVQAGVQEAVQKTEQNTVQEAVREDVWSRSTSAS
jgi:signal transduction histidine kinase